MTAVLELDSDDLWPRDADHRFRLYARKGDSLDVLAAAPSMAAIGTAIGQLDTDARESGREFGDAGQVGVLDAVERRWVVKPWARP